MLQITSFFLRSAFGNEQCYRHQGIVSKAFCAIITEQQAVLLHKPEEQCSSNALVPVDKAVVFYKKVQQVRGLFLKARICLCTPRMSA